MHLNEYVESCISHAQFKTKHNLTLVPPLLTTFRNLRTLSEADVHERGVNLYWNKNTKQVEASETKVGTSTGLDLGTKKECATDRYIGDCHTHPYERKYGVEAHIGPSISDYQEWWVNPPQQSRFHNFALHFVISNATVFLLITRAQTKHLETQLVEAIKQAPSDHPPLTPIDDRCSDEPDFADLMSGKDYGAQKRAIASDSRLKEVPARFAAANRKMNIDLANKLICEYYIGQMDEGAKALLSCELTLKSNSVYVG
jgi:hypothetical protein